MGKKKQITDPKEKAKLDMENNTSINHETANNANPYYKAFIVWVKANGRAFWNYYDPRDEEVYSKCKVLLKTDNKKEAVSLSVDYNLNAL